MTHASHIALIEHELDGFHQSLAIYRQKMNAGYARALDSVSHTADLPSLLGMDRVLQEGDSRLSVGVTDTDFIGAVAVCQFGGEPSVNAGEPTLPAPTSSQEKTVRVRHYTSRAGSKGIEKEGGILA